MTERLRYFVFEVPRELWQLNLDNLPRIPALMWDSEEYSQHKSRYRGPLGQVYCSSDGSQVTLIFVVKLELPDSPSILWRTIVDPLGTDGDIEDVRGEAVASIFLEADPPVQLLFPQGAHLCPPGLPKASIPTSDA